MKKNKVHSRHGSRSLAVSRHEYFENSETHEFPSLLQSFYDSGCKGVNGCRTMPAFNTKEEMIRLRDLGANTPIGVAYTEEQILSMVLKGKQRGHIAGRGPVLPGRGKTSLPDDPLSPTGTYTDKKIDELLAEKDKKIKSIEEDAKETRKELRQLMSIRRGNPQWAEMISQMSSVAEVGSGSGSGTGESGAGGSGDQEDGSDSDDEGH